MSCVADNPQRMLKGERVLQNAKYERIKTALTFLSHLFFSVMLCDSVLTVCHSYQSDTNDLMFYFAHVLEYTL